MPGFAITATAVLQCPHGGMVQIIGTNFRVSTFGAFLALTTDQYTIVGCSNAVPCTKVIWVPSPRVLVAGQPTVFFGPAPTGTCVGTPPAPVVLLPQGEPAVFSG